MTKICHITTVHPRYDVRIFIKECKSLAKRYDDVNLIVADGKGNENIDGINIFDVGKPNGRLQRILKFPRKAYKKAIAIDADIYHFHDSELLSTGVKLAKKGKTVIYDSHEDLPRQILTKSWIPKFLRKTVSRMSERMENRKVRRLSAVVTATPHIEERFKKVTNAPVKNINNYPDLDDITFNPSWENKENAVCYVGGLFYTRGIHEMVAAIGATSSKLFLAGKFSPESLIDEMKNKKGWENVDFLGYLDRKNINEVLQKSIAGLIILHPMPSYLDSLPVKMFESWLLAYLLFVPILHSGKKLLKKTNAEFALIHSTPMPLQKKYQDCATTKIQRNEWAKTDARLLKKNTIGALKKMNYMLFIQN